MTKRTKRTREVGRSGVHDTKMKRRKAKKGGKPNFEDNEKGEKDEDDEKDEKDEEDERTSGPIRRARESGKKTKSTFFQNEKEGRSDSKNACLFFLTAAGARAKKNTTSGEEYQRMAMNLTGEFPDRDFLVSSPDREILNPRRRARRRRSPLAQTETTRSGNPQIEKSWMIGEARRRGRRSSSPGPRAHDRIRESPDRENLGERRAPRRQRAKTRREGQDRGAGDGGHERDTRAPAKDRGRPRRAGQTAAGSKQRRSAGSAEGKSARKRAKSPRAARKKRGKRPQIKKKKKGSPILKD